MDAKALAVLEYPAIVERLAVATATEAGEALARALVPSSDEQEVRARQALTAEGMTLVEDGLAPALGPIADVRVAARDAARGATLDTARLHAVAAAVAVALPARERLIESADTAPLLAEVAERIDPALKPLAAEIGHAVEDDGSDLRDTASPRLRTLRRELRRGREQAAEELRRLARGSELREHLQEDFVTRRAGRPVLAVKASARSKVPGIVHDASSSGQTIFVEPFAVVELNNRLAEAAGAEREEAERILRALSSTVGASVEPLDALVEATAELDLVFACAHVSRAWSGTPIEISTEVRLRAARHPLLDPSAAVPIDLDLAGLRALVVSGPNAGGKTVALKTLGLAALAHQAGLRPPAAAAALPIFDRVLADIGDEQSIAMNLSTFSGHVANLVAILRAATLRSLVLLDEVASGTDPVEGAALAQALVARLAEQARLTAVTTHYPELKEWASATTGVANAATGIDPESHAPLYRLVVGRPGTSHALGIAERLGLEAGVVADARARVAPERLRAAELLAEAEAAERAAREERRSAEGDRAEAAALTRRLGEREEALAAEIAAVRASAERERELARAQARDELAQARVELAALREEVRVARRQEQRRLRSQPQQAVRAEAERDRRLGAAASRAVRADDALQALERPLAAVGPLAPGDPVEAPEVGVRGTIAAIDGDEAEVVGRGGLRVRVALARLRPDPRGRAEAERMERPVRVAVAATADVADELDVRGRYAQEAREAVRAFVDAASLAGLPLVRVVHGRGTGAVRTAVRDELGRHVLVERHEPDSADGATIAHLGRARV